MRFFDAATLVAAVALMGCGDDASGSGAGGSGAAGGSGGSGAAGGGATGDGGSGGGATGNCPAEGTGTMVGDQIGDFAAQHCNGDPAPLHDFCGEGNVLWVIVGADPWCPPCVLAVQAAADTVEARADEGVSLMAIMSQDEMGNPPSQQTCDDYPSMPDPGLLFLNQDNFGEIGMTMTLQPDAMGSFTVPHHFFLRTDDMTLVERLVGHDQMLSPAIYNTALDAALAR